MKKWENGAHIFKRGLFMKASMKMAQMLELSLRDFKVMITKDLEKSVDNMGGQMR